MPHFGLQGLGQLLKVFFDWGDTGRMKKVSLRRRLMRRVDCGGAAARMGGDKDRGSSP